MVHYFPERSLSDLPLLGLAGGSDEQRQSLIAAIVSASRKQELTCLVVQFSPTCGNKKQVDADIITLSKSSLSEQSETEISDKLYSRLSWLSDFYDFIILDTRSSLNVATICLGNENTIQHNTLCHYRSSKDFSILMAAIIHYLEKIEAFQTVWGCILIGGKSSRMGQPKHLLQYGTGLTWLETQVASLAKLTDQIVLSGKGDIPVSLQHLSRISDVANAEGPLAGILAAMRWNPHVSWLFCACDMPHIDSPAIKWLLDCKKPGVWGIVPHHPGTGKLEPLFAFYDRRCRNLFETLLQTGDMRPSVITENDKIHTPRLPEHLADSLENCNTPDDVANLHRRAK